MHVFMRRDAPLMLGGVVLASTQAYSVQAYAFWIWRPSVVMWFELLVCIQVLKHLGSCSGDPHTTYHLPMFVWVFPIKDFAAHAHTGVDGSTGLSTLTTQRVRRLLHLL